MDDLKKKWNKALSSFGTSKPKAFKGSGQKLGAGELPKVDFHVELMLVVLDSGCLRQMHQLRIGDGPGVARTEPCRYPILIT